MKLQQFTLETLTAAVLVNVNPRAELSGKEHMPACDLKFEIRTSNGILSEFGPQLRDALYWNSGEEPDQGELDAVEPVSDKPNLRNPMVGPLTLSTELAGYTLTVDLGLGGKKSNIELGSCEVNQFRIEAMEGGTVAVTFRIQCHPNESELGRLAMKIQQEVKIMLTAPAVEPELEGA